MAAEPIARISLVDLESLIATLEVRFVALTECLVSCGYCLNLRGHDETGIHYNLRGRGTAFIGDGPPIELAPHTLIIVPPHSPFRIEVAKPGRDLMPIDGRLQPANAEGLRRVVAGEGPPEVVLICGFFHALYGASEDLFGGLAAPVIEQFRSSDGVDQRLNAAVDELVSQEIGSGVMTATLLKQVLVMLLRRSLTSMSSWVERFAPLGDREIARAFSEMTAEPGRAHTVESLARRAGLSRSTFMARFVATIGRPPMVVLRDLRMRQAARQLTTSNDSVEQIASNAGYESRSSFARAFQKVFATDPSEYRASHRRR